MIRISSLHTGSFKLDGGSMFGVVPKRMWEKLNPPDENNLCSWAMRALLVETGNRVILIDTGIGNKQDDKFRSHFQPHGEHSLFGALEMAGIRREQVTDVLLTHLHFDHCGGAIWRNEAGNTEAAFPNAVYWSNQRHFDWAMQPNERERASFLKENFEPLHREGRMQFVPLRQNFAFDKHIRLRFVYGHTEAMMVPIIQAGKQKLIYCADLLPSQWHVGMPYVMAYDVRPLLTLQEKARLLEDAAKENHQLLLEHDPLAEYCRVAAGPNGRIGVVETGCLGG